MTTRVSRDQMLMEVAQAVARRGTCSRKQVGVVVAREGRVLVTGYNGTPAGMPHCGHEVVTVGELKDRGGHWYPRAGLTGSHDDTPMFVTQWGNQITATLLEHSCPASVHAEANAIAFAARYGMSLDGAELFTTYAPCLTCAKLSVNAGIRRVVMCERYHDPAGITLLTTAGVRAEMGH